MALGVESELVGSQLKNAGLYGAIISVLLATILFLVAYIRSLHKTAAKVYAYRLAERDTLKDALSESKAAILAQVEASNERNKLTEELVRVISTANAQADTLNALLKLQFEFLKDDHSRLNLVVSAMSDSVRNLSTSSQTIQTGVQALPPMLSALEKHIENLLPRRVR
jgi:hypothetical protein